MRPTSATKKPAELGFPTIEKSPPQLKHIHETYSTRNLISSPSNRLLTNLTSNPLSKRCITPLNCKSATNITQTIENRNISPKYIKDDSSKNSPRDTEGKQYKRFGEDLRIFTDDEDVIIAKDYQFTGELYHKASSTKCTDKDSEATSINEEEEKEREKLSVVLDQLGLYGVRPSQRGTLKRKEKYGQLMGNQDKKRMFNNELSKVTFPEQEEQDNRQTLKSTVVIVETPGDSDNAKFSNDDTQTISCNLSFEKQEDKITLSDLMTNTTRPSERLTTPKNAKRKSKINLEIYLAIEDLLRAAKEAKSSEKLQEIFREYIDIVPKKDLEGFEKIFSHENETKLIKSSFVLERLAVVVVLFFTGELKSDKRVGPMIRAIVEIIYNNCILFGYLVAQKVANRSLDNVILVRVWVERLIEVIESEERVVAAKEKVLDDIQKNNLMLCNTMKTMILTLQNKEIMYGFNAIIVQVDRISIKDAYSRLFKCFSLYISQQELKSQDPKNKNTARKSSKEGRATVREITKQASSQNEIETERKSAKPKKEEEPSFYLPKLDLEKSKTPFTLVMDLDETLVHFAEIPGHYSELRVRPYVDHFLTEVSKYYEVVIFTTGTQDYADWVLDNIDKRNCVSHRLYRHHASVDPDTLNFIKDLSKLGRDLGRVLIVDNLPENFKLQPDNGIAIKPWYDDHEDNALLELAPLLVEIAKKKVPDVREALRKFREQMIQNIEKGCENPHLNLTLD